MATTMLSPTVRSEFKVLCRGPKITTVVEGGRWRVVPLELDTSPIPPHAMVRVQRLYELGVRPEQFLVAHENHVRKTISVQEKVIRSTGIDWELLKRIGVFVSLVVGVIVTVATVIAILAAIMVVLVTLATGAVILFILGSAIAYDPVLVAVLEDGTWLEVDSWDE